MTFRGFPRQKCTISHFGTRASPLKPGPPGLNRIPLPLLSLQLSATYNICNEKVSNHLDSASTAPFPGLLR
jgi:hypothetical protein